MDRSEQDVIDQALAWRDEGRKVALATVIATWGSSPRPVGSQLAVDDAGHMVGSVSGGCIEGAVVKEAQEIMAGAKPRLLDLGITNEQAWEVGLACGGKIDVLVEPLDLQWWQLASQAAELDKTLKTITVLDGDDACAKIALDAVAEIVYSNERLSPEKLHALLSGTVPAQSGRATLAGFEVMVDIFWARPHLVMVGGVHIAMSLQHFAKMLGFRVSLIDPRDAFATDERFPDVDCILHAYPDKALAQLGIDGNTYLAVLTHDPKIDDPALKAALASKPAYVGILGSKRTHEKRIERLTEAGIAASDLARLNAPIGLAIGASTPEEIALSVMAEIVAVKNKKPVAAPG